MIIHILSTGFCFVCFLSFGHFGITSVTCTLLNFHFINGWAEKLCVRLCMNVQSIGITTQRLVNSSFFFLIVASIRCIETIDVAIENVHRWTTFE